MRRIATDTLDALARDILAAQQEARQIEPFSQRVAGFDLDAGYQVAQRVHAGRVAAGARPVGRKIGFTNYGMWERYGVRDPIWAHLYDTTVESLQADYGRCSLGPLAEPKIEPEVVFHFRHAPPVTTDLTAIIDAIDWVAPAFEIVQSHFPEWRFEAADCVADASLHGRLLLGAPQPLSALGSDPIAALENFSLALYCNDELIETGRGNNVLGSPLKAVAHLVDLLSRQPQSPPLAAGEIVTTGTITLAHTVAAQQRWHSAIDVSLPGLTVNFDD